MAQENQMPKFIVLTLDDGRARKKTPPPNPTPGQKRFQDWSVGDFLVRKTNRHDRIQITAIQGGRMTYAVQVTAENVSSGDQRSYSSSTLQAAFEHDPVLALGDPSGEEPVHAVMPKVGKRCAFNVDHIRNFYPRKDDREGTRIMTSNGVAYAVLDSFDDVLLQTQDSDVEEDPEA